MTRELLHQIFKLHQMPVSDTEPESKLITSYCEPWSLRAGDSIEWFGSSLLPTQGFLDVVKLDCGDPTRSGPGFSEQSCDVIKPTPIDLVEQPLLPGSYAEARIEKCESEASLTLSFWFQPTLLKRDGVIASVASDDALLEIYNSGSSLMGRFGSVELSLRTAPLERRRWYHLTVQVDGSREAADVTVVAPRSASPGRDLLQEGIEESTLPIPSLTFTNPVFRLAAGPGGDRWDGRIAEPHLRIGDVIHEWSFAADLEDREIFSIDGDMALRLFQLPTRGVTGPDWTGEHQRWTDRPEQWNAIHFHH
ncbi:MAG: hypothetical protein VX410_01880, partial [Actinomycetota bacterium]|nr:hypothetical protein [Actinomycetota bacterium]